MVPSGSEDLKMVSCLFVAGTRCQLLVINMISTLWANLILKRQMQC